jgi:magnesium/cobalt transport protein CorA
MISRHEYRGGVWIDLEQPTPDEVREIAQEFSVSERLEREMLSPTPTPLVASEGGKTMLVLHFPAHGAEDGKTENQELDFIVGSNVILTVRYEIVAPLHHLQKLLETQELVSKNPTLTTDVLLEVLFAHLYTSVHDHTNHIVSHLAHIEAEMFNGNERTTVRSILDISREFLHMETALANQEEPLDRFFKTLIRHEVLEKSFEQRTERILAERTQVARLIETHRAVATELRETNIALLSSRQNEIMKTLTVVTFIFLPLELITFIFSMHMLGTPLEQNPNAFWIILASMFGVLGLMVLILSKKRWLN